MLLFLKNQKGKFDEQLIAELKINLQENNLNLIESLNRKISESEQKQIKELMNNKLETVEKLQVNSDKLTQSFLIFKDNTYMISCIEFRDFFDLKRDDVPENWTGKTPPLKRWFIKNRW